MPVPVRDVPFGNPPRIADDQPIPRVEQGRRARFLWVDRFTFQRCPVSPNAFLDSLRFADPPRTPIFRLHGHSAFAELNWWRSRFLASRCPYQFLLPEIAQLH